MSLKTEGNMYFKTQSFRRYMNDRIPLAGKNPRHFLERVAFGMVLKQTESYSNWGSIGEGLAQQSTEQCKGPGLAEHRIRKTSDWICT